MEGIKLMEEKGCEVARAWNLPKTELPKIIGENDAIIMRSATRVKAELIGKARKLTVVDALERPAS
jgi:phosphoglycerate dehydrogenase-like enzyme